MQEPILLHLLLPKFENTLNYEYFKNQDSYFTFPMSTHGIKSIESINL